MKDAGFSTLHICLKTFWGKTWDLSFFPLFLFYPHFPTTWCFHFIYFKCCQRGMCFFFFGGIYRKRWGFKKKRKKSVAFCGKTNHEHSLGVFVKLPCMYSMHVNVVVQAWLQYIRPSALSSSPPPPLENLNPSQMEEICS